MADENVTTVQLTSKRYKGAGLAARCLIFGSPVIGIASHTFLGFIGSFILGFGLLFYASIGAWWNNR